MDAVPELGPDLGAQTLRRPGRRAGGDEAQGK